MVLLCLTAAFALTTACGKAALPPQPPESFSATADIRAGEVHMKAALRQASPGSLRAEFSAPPELKDMTLELNGTNARLIHGEIEEKWPAEALPETGFLRLLRQALLQVRTDGAIAVPERNGGWRLDGESGGYRYSALLDTNGRLSRLTAPDLALAVTLTYAAG